MYLIKVSVKNSPIEGKGVFALEDVAEGTIAWKFDPAWDKTLSPEEFEALGATEKEALLRVAYLSQYTNCWIYPPQNDPALFTNHSISNNLSVVFNKTISEESFFRTNKAIAAGEELTVNYFEFDSRPKDLVAGWK